LFDRANFFVVRISLNVGFALGITSFFTTDSMIGLVLSAVIFGVSAARRRRGLEPVGHEDRAAQARGRLHERAHVLHGRAGARRAPRWFAIVDYWSIQATGWLSAGLILAATLMLLPEVKHGGLVRHGAPPTPPVAADEGGS
jgi:hypothetical protein